MKPSFTDRFSGAWSISSSDLAEVRSALRRPVLWRAGSLAAIIVTVVLLMSGVWWNTGVDGVDDTAIAAPTVNGQAIGSASVVEIDLREPIRVTGRAASNSDLRLELSVFDVEIASIDSEPDGGGGVVFEPGWPGHMTSGRVDATLVAVDPDPVTGPVAGRNVGRDPRCA